MGQRPVTSSKRLAVLLAVFLACLVAFIAAQRAPAPPVVVRDAEVEPDAEVPLDAEVAEDAEVPSDAAAPRDPVTAAGTFRYAEDERPGTLMPFFAERASEIRLGELLFDSLLREDKRGEIEGRLATHWSVDPDKRGMRVTLRRGVKWHDGRPFTAEDVVFTVDAAQDPGTLFSAKGKFAFIRVVEIEDAEHLHVVFARPVAEPERRFDFKILPAHAFESASISRTTSFARAPIGTGPYRLADFGFRIIALDANPDYWEPVHIARVQMVYSPDKAAQLRYLQSDDPSLRADLVPWLPPKYIPLFEHSATVALDLTSTGEWWFVAVNHAHPALADRAVRQAMSLAVDRLELLESHLGLGESLSGPFTASSPFYDIAVQPARVDVEAANALLDTAGWVRDATGRHKGAVRLDFELAIDKARPAGPALFEEFRRAWAKIGVTLRPRFLDSARFRQVVFSEKAFDLVLSAWNFQTLKDVAPLFHSQGALNFTNFRSRAVDATLDAARRAKDDAVYEKHMRRLHAQVADELPYLFLFTVEFVSGLNKRVRNAHITPFTYFGTFPEWTLAP